MDEEYDIYEDYEEMAEDDEINPDEEGFMKGFDKAYKERIENGRQ